MSDAKDLHTELDDLATQLDTENDALAKATQIYAQESKALAELVGKIEVGRTFGRLIEEQLAEQKASLKTAEAALKTATAAADKARAAFEKAADKQGLSNRTVKSLYGALNRAIAERDKASDGAASAQSAISLTKSQLERIKAEYEEQSKARKAKEKQVEEAQIDRQTEKEKVARTIKEMDAKRDELGKALAEAGGEAPQPPARPLGGLVDLYRKQGEAEVKDFLTIKTRRIDFDDWADDAFAALEKWAADRTPREIVLKSTLDAGVGSDIDAVTRKLNRRRISDLRREILARTYPMLLRKRLEDEQNRQPRDQPFVVKTQVAEDHTGLADTIALDLDAKTNGSPRDVFSEFMTRIAVQNLNLNAPVGSPEYEILKAKICAST